MRSTSEPTGPSRSCGCPRIARTRPHDGEGLERLRRRAQVGDEPGIAGSELDPAVADGDGVDDVPRLDDVSARHLDDEWLHGAAA
jgi:hypothetical protein